VPSYTEPQKNASYLTRFLTFPPAVALPPQGIFPIVRLSALVTLHYMDTMDGKGDGDTSGLHPFILLPSHSGVHKPIASASYYNKNTEWRALEAPTLFYCPPAIACVNNRNLLKCRLSWGYHLPTLTYL
jgi:hypothetical protein